MGLKLPVMSYGLELGSGLELRETGDIRQPMLVCC